MSYYHFFQTLKPNSQEMAQNFEKDVLQKCLRITFYTYIQGADDKLGQTLW
jgi:hypothetical protein